MLGARHSTLRLHKAREPGRRPRPRPHRRADRRHHLRPDPRRRRGGQHQPAALPSCSQPDESGLDRVRPGPPAPLRRRDHQGAEGRLTPGTMKITAITPLPGLGRHPQPAPRQGRDRRGHLRLGRERPLRPREGGGRRHRALRASSSIGRDPFAIGALWQEMYRSQYFEGGRVLHRRDLGDRHRAPRHQGQGARRAGPRAPRRQAARRHPDLRHHPRPLRPGDDRAGARADGAWAGPRSASSPPATTPQDVYEPRESIAETASWCVKAREALGDDVVLGVDYHHRLSVAEAASFCQKMPSRHARLPRGADPRRDAGGLRGAPPADRRPLRHRRGVLLEVAVPALHRARHPPVQPHRRLQRRRPHRGDEGRRLERGALRRHDAAQPARAGLHRGDAPLRRRRRRTSPGSRRRATPGELYHGFDDAELFPVQPRSKAPSTASPTAPASASRSTRRCVRKQSFKFWEAPHLRRTDGSVTNW